MGATDLRMFEFVKDRRRLVFTVHDNGNVRVRKGMKCSHYGCEHDACGLLVTQFHNALIPEMAVDILCEQHNYWDGGDSAQVFIHFPEGRADGEYMEWFQ